MRKMLLGTAVLIAGLVGANAALAADWSSMTCSDFVKMAPADQASIASQVGPAAQSMTSNSTGGGTNNSANATTTAGAAGTTVTAGQLVAACEAAPANQTLHDLAAQPGALGTPAAASSSTTSTSK